MSTAKKPAVKTNRQLLEDIAKRSEDTAKRIKALEAHCTKQDLQLTRLIYLQRWFLARLVQPVRYPLTEYLEWRACQTAARLLSTDEPVKPSPSLEPKFGGRAQ